MPPCKKVTKENGIGEALTAKPIGFAVLVQRFYPGFEPPSPMYPFRRWSEDGLCLPQVGSLLPFLPKQERKAPGRDRKFDYETAQDNRMLSKADNLKGHLFRGSLDYRLKTAYGR